MRLIDRYLLRELLIPLFFCLAGGLAFYMTFDLFSTMDDLRRNEAGVTGVFLYSLAKIPQLLVLILPPALLLALLYAISNHSRHNELVAIRAAGVNIWRICAPYLMVAALLGALLFYLNEDWAPQGEKLAQSIRKGRKVEADQVFENINFINTTDGRVWNIGKYHVKEMRMESPCVEFVRRSETDVPEPLSIVDRSQPKGDTVKIMAESAQWISESWVFKNAQVFTYLYGGEDAQASLPVPERYPELSLAQIDDTPEQIESEIFISTFDSFKSARKAHLSLSQIQLYLDSHAGTDNQLIRRIKTLYYSRMASPFTCIVVVLVALPFSLQGGRRNVFVGVASSIVICFCFFLLNEVSLALGAGGYMSPWLSAWLPNLLFGLGGFAAVRKLV